MLSYHLTMSHHSSLDEQGAYPQAFARYKHNEVRITGPSSCFSPLSIQVLLQQLHSLWTSCISKPQNLILEMSMNTLLFSTCNTKPKKLLISWEDINTYMTIWYRVMQTTTVTLYIHIPAVNWIFTSPYFSSAFVRSWSTYYCCKGLFRNLSMVECACKLSEIV